MSVVCISVLVLSHFRISPSLSLSPLPTPTPTPTHCSNRLGIRMEGPRPKFARPDGGEGGSHPSNVHDHVYALGALNFTGDMPICLLVDGPSLGGFVCPATVTSTELWKMGQASVCLWKCCSCVCVGVFKGFWGGGPAPEGLGAGLCSGGRS